MNTDTDSLGRRGEHDLQGVTAGIDIPISLGGETTLPLAEIVTGRGAIFGKSGAGKSNAMGVLTEELLERGVPMLIVDAEGEYVGLKEEYEVLHAGAHEECDVTVSARSADTLADTVLERDVPTILDTSEFFDEEELVDLVAGVARRLFVRQKAMQKPLLLVLEECHEFIPQTGKDDAKEMFIKIAKRGRKRGLGLCGLSQRPADVAKAFITQCDWLAFHRLTWPNDTAVVKDLLDAEHAEAVQELTPGEAFILSDWTTETRRVQWRRQRTPDYGAAPAIEQVLGAAPDRIGADVYAEFDADAEMDLPDSATEYLEHLLDEVAALDTYETYILDFVRAHGPIDPKRGYALAGGDPESNAVYSKYRSLREAGLIQKAGRAEYAYTLADRVESQLRFNPEVEEEHITAIVDRVEDEFAGTADDPEETEPEPVTTGDTLGTYRVHENDGGGYAQPGKPVVEYLGVGPEEPVAVEIEDSALSITTDDGDESEADLSYTAFGRGGRGYAQFTLGASAISALGAAPGDILRADAADGAVRVVIAPEADE